MKTNHTLVATHPAFGTVTFVISATDAKTAFSLWKQIVHSSRQWVVTHNSGAWAEPKQEVIREPVPVSDDERDLSPIDDI